MHLAFDIKTTGLQAFFSFDLLNFKSVQFYENLTVDLWIFKEMQQNIILSGRLSEALWAFILWPLRGHKWAKILLLRFF